MTLSEIIWEKINEVRNSKAQWSPEYLSEVLVDMSVLHASLTEKVAEFENAYYKVLDLAMQKEEKLSVARAEISAKAGEEYLTYKKAFNLEKSLVECIRSIKKFIKVRGEEKEVSYNQ